MRLERDESTKAETRRSETMYLNSSRTAKRRTLSASMSLIALLAAVLWPSMVQGATGDEKFDIRETNLARGFEPGETFSFDGLDDINLFNGNLTLTIPVGLSYPVGGGFSYQLQLVYNSSIWDVHAEVDSDACLLEENEDKCCNGESTQAWPAHDFNAGVGWKLTLGELYPPMEGGVTSDQPDKFFVPNQSNKWLYVAPDGSKHLFFDTLYDFGTDDGNGFVSYTRDGSYLRMTSVATEGWPPAPDTTAARRVVEEPSGLRRFFYFNQGQNRWLPYRIEHPREQNGMHAGALDISYAVNPTNGQWEWTLSDTHGRVHKVFFDRMTPDGNTRYRWVLNRAVMKAFRPDPATDETVVWSFNVNRSVSLDPPTHLEKDPANRTLTVPMLTSVVAQTPGGGTELQRFDFSYNSGTLASGAQGMLGQVLFPTGGVIQYEYADFIRPAVGWFEDDFYTGTGGTTGGPVFDPAQAGGCAFKQNVTSITKGVGTKKTLLAEGSTEVLARWKYELRMEECSADDLAKCPNPVEPTSPGPPREVVTTVTHPDDHLTHHYFSAFPGNEHGVANDGGTQDFSVATRPNGTTIQWLREEFGAPISKRNLITSNVSVPVYLSVQHMDTNGTTFLRTEARAFESEPCIDVLNPGACLARTRDDHYSNAHRREKAHVVKYEQDSVAGTRRETLRKEFDGLGNYRAVVVQGSGGLASAPRTTVTGYNRDSGGNNGSGQILESQTGTGRYSNFTLPPEPRDGIHPPWVVTDFALSAVEETVGSTTERITTQRCVDPGTGLLTAERTIAGSAQTTDAVKIYNHNELGDVRLIRWYGGERTPVPSALFEPDICAQRRALELEPAEYRVAYGYQSGTRSSVTVQDDCGGGDVLRLMSRNIDANTGLVRAASDPSGFTVRHDYDLLGRLVEAVPDEGLTSRFVYTLGGGVNNVEIKELSPSGTEERFRKLKFDNLGRLVEEIERYPGNVLHRRFTTYDTSSRVATVSIWGNAAKTTRNSYDVFNRVTAVTRPDGSVTTTDYTGERLVARTVDVQTPSGLVDSTRSETYDVHGQLVAVTEPSGTGGANVTTSYGYDLLGNLTGVSTPIAGGGTQTRTFTYDHRGLLRSEDHPETDRIAHKNYDARGLVGTIERPNTPDPGVTEIVSFDYDQLGRPTVVYSNGELLKSFVYGTSGNATGRLIEARRMNQDVVDIHSGVERDLSVVETFEYDGVARALSKKITRIPQRGTVRVFAQSYAYNSLGELATITYPFRCADPTCTTAATGETVRNVSLTFDDGRLTAVPNFGSLTYHPGGLIHTITTGNGVVATQGRDPLDRPSGITFSGPWSGPGAYAYDPAGNVTEIGGDRYQYDKIGRLAAGHLLPAGAPQSTFSYGYDRFGNLLSATRNGTATGIGVNAATNRLSAGLYDGAGRLRSWEGFSFTYDAMNRVRELTDPSGNRHPYLYNASDERIVSLAAMSGGGREEHYTVRGLGDQVLREYEFTPESGWAWDKDYVYRGGRLLAAETPAGRRYYHLDHLGSTRLVTDPAGAQVALYHYWPFGAEAPGTVRGDERLLFTGHEREEFDAATERDDLDYQHARYYLPFFGRYTSTDEVLGRAEEPQSWGRYSYVQNSPLTSIDPNGRTTYKLTSSFTLAVPSGGKVEGGLVFDNHGNIGVTATWGVGGGLIGEVGVMNVGVSSAETVFDAGGSSVDVDVAPFGLLSYGGEVTFADRLDASMERSVFGRIEAPAPQVGFRSAGGELGLGPGLGGGVFLTQTKVRGMSVRSKRTVEAFSSLLSGELFSDLFSATAEEMDQRNAERAREIERLKLFLRTRQERQE